MLNSLPIKLHYKAPRDIIAVVTLAVCLSLSSATSLPPCWSQGIPAVTSMQRSIPAAAPRDAGILPSRLSPPIVPQQPSMLPPSAMPPIADSAPVTGGRAPMPLPKGENSGSPALRLPAVTAPPLIEQPRPAMLPEHDLEPRRDRRQPSRLPNRLQRLPVPTAEPDVSPERLPVTKSSNPPLSPQFAPWQPPGISLPARGTAKPTAVPARLPAVPARLPAVPDSDNALHLMPPLSSAVGRPAAKIAKISQTGHAEPPSTDPLLSAGLIDRSLCPSMPWPHANDFSSTTLPVDPWFHDTDAEQAVYDDKRPVATQRPLIEWGRKYYGSGITPPSESWLGDTNLVQQQLYLYGDYRSGIATGRNEVGRIDNWASRLNLDLDYRITATERFHAFFGPLNRATQFTRLEREGDDWDYKTFYNLNPATAFFEGDAGALLGGAAGTPSPFELPFTAGLVPLVFQNGIWFEDAASGVAFAIPARHSRALNWANFDATFFAVFDQINSPAFGADNHAAQAFGTAWFIDAYDGYIESGYAYLNDRHDLGRSYHNMTASFTRRYFDRISNSVRVIVNAGQDLPRAERTAEGVLLLVENSLVTPQPYTVVPYLNLFSGWERPQSVARAGVSGGVLRNTGINFEIDGLNGYPTLDATGADAAGGSVGIDLIGKDFDHQWLLEAAYVTPHGDRALINGDQYALGTRYQTAISHCSIIRFDTMYGWRENDGDLYGSRLEYRWKF